MKNVLWILLSLLIASPLAVRAANDPIPNAVKLMDRVMQVNTGPGAVTITVTDVQRVPGQAERHIQSTAQWNDATHYRFTSTNGRNEIIGVSNGASRVLYKSVDNSYERDGTHAKFAMPLLRGGLMTIAPALKDPESRPDFAKGVVTPTDYEGEPVYRIFVQPRPKEKKVYFALLVGRSDLLVRKLVLYIDESRSDTMTARYHKEPQPFPASTFMFSPPVGAREVRG
jgi:hypothetical protein